MREGRAKDPNPKKNKGKEGDGDFRPLELMEKSRDPNLRERKGMEVKLSPSEEKTGPLPFLQICGKERKSQPYGKVKSLTASGLPSPHIQGMSLFHPAQSFFLSL